MARVSVIVPAYNRADLIGATLASVQAQTVGSWELIVVDDGSADETAAVAQRVANVDPRIRVMRQANGGVASARNTGIAAADPRTEFAMFLDSDDVLAPDALEVLCGALAGAPDASAAYGLARQVDQHGQPSGKGEVELHQRSRRGVRDGKLVTWPPDAPTTFEVLAFWNYIWTPGGVLVRRANLAAVGEFDTSIDPADDWDMWMRLSLTGPLLFLDRVVIDWRLHGAQITKATSRVDRATRATRAKLLSRNDLTVAQRTAAHQGWRCDCGVRLEFAARAARCGRLLAATREVGRACAGYARYVRAARAAAAVRMHPRASGS